MSARSVEPSRSGAAPAGGAAAAGGAEAPAARGRSAEAHTADRLRQLVRNGAALLLAYVLPKLFTIVSVVVAARVLGTRAFGEYSTAAALAVILSILATLGMIPLLVREIALSPERAPALLAAAHRVKTVAAAMMLIALYVLARWVLDFGDAVVLATMLLGVGYAVGAYAENLAAYYQAVERMHVWTQASALFGLTTGVLGIVLVVSTRSVVWFCAAPIVGHVASLGWLLYRAPVPVRRPARRACLGDDASAVALSRALVPFAAAFIALTVYYKVDVLLLSRWRDAVEVGVYSAAYRFVDVLHALVLVAAGAVYPSLSRQAAVLSGERWAGTRLIELGLLAGVPGAAVLWLLRIPLVAAMFGSQYAASAPVVGWFALAIPALVLNLLAGYVLGAAGRMRPVAVGYTLAALANAGLNALLIPRWGAVGAAVAMVVTESALAAGLVAVLAASRAAPSWRALRAGAVAALLAPLMALGPAVLGRIGAGVDGATVASPLDFTATTGNGAGAALASAAVYLALVGLVYRRARVLEPTELDAVRRLLRGDRGRRPAP